MMDKISGVTSYSGFTRFYFLRILSQIIEIGDLKRTNKKILDFGCGFGFLKERLGPQLVTNFDIVEELSDVSDWRAADFQILVANQVFSAFDKDSLAKLLIELRDYNPKLTLIIGTSKRGIFNKLGMFLTARRDAHDSTVLKLNEEMLIYFNSGLKVIEKRSVFFLCDILKMRFDLTNDEI